MKLKRILIFAALVGTPLALTAMSKEEVDAWRKSLAEEQKKIAMQQAVFNKLNTLEQENIQQEDEIKKLKTEISSLNAKLFFWRTPAIITGVAAAVYGSWMVYGWWTGNDNSITFDDASFASESDEQDVQPSAPELSALENSQNEFGVPNNTPPGK
jgi:hypothetical protein